MTIAIWALEIAVARCKPFSTEDFEEHLTLLGDPQLVDDVFRRITARAQTDAGARVRALLVVHRLASTLPDIERGLRFRAPEDSEDLRLRLIMPVLADLRTIYSPSLGVDWLAASDRTPYSLERHAWSWLVNRLASEAAEAKQGSVTVPAPMPETCTRAWKAITDWGTKRKWKAANELLECFGLAAASPSALKRAWFQIKTEESWLFTLEEERYSWPNDEEERARLTEKVLAAPYLWAWVPLRENR